ncbi:hypothetical protein BGM26_13940 [Bacillus sp. FJAT-29790]|uniref:hypothetical protein n=1 Tax=Bacillus sp. FJAT-29790 TaxID=1895002 RepID=UPI001C217A3D|nr:hypothetical protein [Bacillus sp. FJAT-29790]MBU8880079.1 hypothetical protein [Bacillus sp. FJAT-29790]
MKVVSVNKLKFKKNLSMIEQYLIKDFLFQWIGRPTEGLDEILPLDYTEDVFAKMEAKQETSFLINADEYFRYATITEDEQFIIGVLNWKKELQHRIISLDVVC